MARPSHVDEEDWSKLQSDLSRIGVNSGGAPLAKLISAGPADLGNDATIELVWAEKAHKHAEAHYGILRLMADKSKIKLTQLDDELYARFRTLFPKATFPIGQLDAEALKRKDSKQVWRVFCNAYEKELRIVDFNMGTLLRLDTRGEYTPDNTTVVPRVQFLAIEIARNREGDSDAIRRSDRATNTSPD